MGQEMRTGLEKDFHNPSTDNTLGLMRNLNQKPPHGTTPRSINLVSAPGREHSEVLNDEHKAAGHHEGDGPDEIQIQPSFPKKSQAQLFINHPRNKARYYQVSQGVNENRLEVCRRTAHGGKMNVVQRDGRTRDAISAMHSE